MTIYDWEASTIDVARTWPSSGPIFNFFWFWTDYNQSKWLFLLGLFFLVFKFGWRKLVIPVLFSTAAVSIGDLISRRLIKSYFMRPRPNFINLSCELPKCWGFISSHSTNITAAAVFLILYDRRNAHWAVPVVFLVCFSRIYLIDHFPLDVMGGMIVGAIVGYLLWKVSRLETAKPMLNTISNRTKND